MRILLVEDDQLIARGVVAGLRAHSMAVDHVMSAALAQAALATSCWDAIVLDLGLPDEDGLVLLRRLRAQKVTTPLLILSAREAVLDRIHGLQCGADDYLLKPFDLSELAARLHALVRRAAGRCVDVIEHGALRLTPSSGEVRIGSREITLSRRELRLLHALLNVQGRILTTEQLKDAVYDFDDHIESNAVNVHIHNLRRKLGPDLIETVRGLGYRIGEPAR